MFKWLNEEEEGVVKKKVKSGPKPKITTPPKEIEYYTDPNLLQNRRPRDRFIVLSAGVGEIEFQILRPFITTNSNTARFARRSSLPRCSLQCSIFC